MMLLPPIDLILNSIEKGSVRKLNDFAADKVGISSKQLTNLMLGHSRPRLSTMQKLKSYLESVTDYKISSLFTLRAFSRQNEWVALLNGVEQHGDPNKHFPNITNDIRHLGTLDSRLERLHRKPSVFENELNQITIQCIANKIPLCKLDFTSKKMLRGSLAGLRFHILTYLIACLESEFQITDQQPNDLPSWGQYFCHRTQPRKLFIDRLMSRTGISSKNELARRYSDHSSGDLENRKRHIRRIASGEHAISASDLKFLSGLTASGKDEVITYIEYYLARYAEFQKSIILDAKSKSLTDTLALSDFYESYEQYLHYCLDRKQAQNTAPALKS